MGNQSASASASHRLPDASGGIRQSPLGLSVTEPTFGPSGMHERLNCCCDAVPPPVIVHDVVAADEAGQVECL